MFVEDYFKQSGDVFSIEREQGSSFAKRIAGDFNPLHDPENSRFCVPGDLLFALTLSQFGVSAAMAFDFQGMVGGDNQLQFETSEDTLKIKDQSDKCYLSVQKSGEITDDSTFVEALIRAYVAFSGETFPHILVNLMRQQGVMINPDRPMVIYESMAIEFTEFSDTAPVVNLAHSSFEVNGKRGIVTLEFSIEAAGKAIGTGKKRIIMSGLRPFEESSMQQLVEHYDGLKSAFQ